MNTIADILDNTFSLLTVDSIGRLVKAPKESNNSNIKSLEDVKGSQNHPKPKRKFALLRYFLIAAVIAIIMFLTKQLFVYKSDISLTTLYADSVLSEQGYVLDMYFLTHNINYLEELNDKNHQEIKQEEWSTIANARIELSQKGRSQSKLVRKIRSIYTQQDYNNDYDNFLKNTTANTNQEYIRAYKKYFKSVQVRLMDEIYIN